VSAAAPLARAEAAGLRFRLAPGGGVRMEAAAPPPPDLLADLRRWREDVAHLLAMRQALAEARLRRTAGRDDWRALPFGPERGRAFMEARQAPDACSCCAGRRWWREPGEAAPGRCATCHPPAGEAQRITCENRQTERISATP